MTTEESVVVIGGGIGGLTLAHGLASTGRDVHVIEAGLPGDRLGTGITLLGNALRALDQVDLADDVVAGGYGWNAVSNRDADGNLVHEQLLPPVFRPGGPAAIGIMRTRLAEILERRAKASGTTIDFTTTATAIEQNDSGVSVTLSDGRTLRAGLLVAADGVYSKTRTMVFGDEHRPNFTGQSGWRYTIPRPENLNGLSLYRSGRHVIGGLPLSSDLAYLFYLEHTDEPVRMPADRLGELLRERFEPFAAPELRQAGSEIDDTRHISFRPYDVILMPGPWYRGRVVLLGDAAHALTPQLTSGGGMAIEDAVVLTEALQTQATIAEAVQVYDQRRRARVTPIYENSLRICQLEQDPDNDGQESMRLMIESHGLLAQAM